jgi:hypothetical protein
MPTYQALTGHLKTRQEPVVTMSFAEIERITGPLPKSAKEHRAWWSNGKTSCRQAQYWLDAGRQAKPDFNAAVVRFSIGSDTRRGPNGQRRISGVESFLAQRRAGRD